MKIFLINNARGIEPASFFTLSEKGTVAAQRKICKITDMNRFYYSKNNEYIR